MNIDKLLKWQNENPTYRSMSIKNEARCEMMIPRFYNSVFLYEYRHDDVEKRCVIFPLELVDEIEDFNDFKKIEELVDIYENQKNKKETIPMYLYPKNKYGFNLKGHYFALKLVGIGEILKFAEGKEFETVFKEIIQEFMEETHNIIGSDNLNI